MIIVLLEQEIQTMKAPQRPHFFEHGVIAAQEESNQIVSNGKICTGTAKRGSDHPAALLRISNLKQQLLQPPRSTAGSQLGLGDGPESVFNRVDGAGSGRDGFVSRDDLERTGEDRAFGGLADHRPVLKVQKAVCLLKRYGMDRGRDPRKCRPTSRQNQTARCFRFPGARFP